MNAKEYVDEVKLRLQRHSVVLELDDGTVLTFINRARQEIQMTYGGLYPEFNGRVGVISPVGGYAPAGYDVSVGGRLVYKAQLPLNCTDVKCLITKNGDFRHEARRVDFREYYGVQSQSWNPPRTWSPIYAVRLDSVQSNATYAGPELYICGIAAGSLLEVWYTAIVDFLELFPNDDPNNPADEDDFIPWQFQELVIYNAMLDCMQKIDAANMNESMKAEQKILEQVVQDLYKTTKMKGGSMLPSRQAIAQ
jgi:hypothetical protein